MKARRIIAISAVATLWLTTLFLAWNDGFDQGSDVTACTIAIFKNDDRWPSDDPFCQRANIFESSIMGWARRAFV
jgi:hypothetical protein